MGYLFLVLSVLLTTIFAACYKIANRRGCDLINVNTTVYLAGSVTLLVVSLFTLRGSLWQWAVHHPFAMLVAVLSGFCGYISTICFFYVMMNRHLSTAWTVINLAVVIPILASIVIYHEMPKPLQWVALGLMCLALVALSVGRRDAKPAESPEPATAPDGGGISDRKSEFYLFISFLCTGIVSFSNKMVSEMVTVHQMDRSETPVYMLYYYLSGALTAVAFRAWRTKSFGPKDLWVGGVMGAVGALSILTFLLTLTYMQGIIAFPARSCANLLFTAGVGFFVWKERPGPGGVVGILLGAVALVLVNLK